MNLDNESLEPEIHLDHDDLAYWFPRLAASGLRVPKTEIIHFEGNLVPLLDGEEVEGFSELVSQVRAAVVKVGGYPAFLRTGYGSGKHEWRETCYLGGSQDVPRHISRLVDWSCAVDFMGLPLNTWVVREFLKLRADFTAFEGMPVAREFRVFFRDGKVLCAHFYWPEGSIENASIGESAWKADLATMSLFEGGEGVMLMNQVEKAAAHFDGFWSLDMAQLAEGEGPDSWVAIDMAEGDGSFHWKGCINDPHPERHVEEEKVEVDWSQWLEPIKPNTE